MILSLFSRACSLHSHFKRKEELEGEWMGSTEKNIEFILLCHKNKILSWEVRGQHLKTLDEYPPPQY